jgi:hypothetical protein
LKQERRLRILSENRIFRMVMEKCRGDPTFSLSCWDSKTSSWSEQNVNTFFIFFSEVLMNLFLDLFDGSVMRPNLLNLKEFRRHYDVRMEIEDKDEYNAATQKSTLKQMLEATLERVYIRYHYPPLVAESQENSYLFATNGTKVSVAIWFVRELDPYWINLLLKCGSNAVSNRFSHEALVAWSTKGIRIEQ